MMTEDEFYEWFSQAALELVVECEILEEFTSTAL